MANLFLLSTGTIGIKFSSKMNENVNYIFEYREYTNIIKEVNSNILNIRIELVKLSQKYDLSSEESNFRKCFNW